MNNSLDYLNYIKKFNKINEKNEIRVHHSNYKDAYNDLINNLGLKHEIDFFVLKKMSRYCIRIRIKDKEKTFAFKLKWYEPLDEWRRKL